MARRKKKSQQERIDEALDAAIATGGQYANDQLTSDYFQDWIQEQMAEAEKMERDQPGSTISDPKQIARNMLQQLKWDIHQNMDHHTLSSILDKIETGDPEYVSKNDLSKSFYDGLDEVLTGQPARDWLADEVKHISDEMTAQQQLPGVRDRGSRRSRRTTVARVARESRVHETWVPPVLAREGITPTMLEVLLDGMGEHAKIQPGSSVVYDRDGYAPLKAAGYIVLKRQTPGLSRFGDYYVLTDKGADLVRRWRLEVHKIGTPSAPAKPQRRRHRTPSVR